MRNRPLLPILTGAALSVAAGVAVKFAFFPAPGASWEGPPSSGPAQILRADLKRDYQNGILTLEVTFDNSSPDPIRLEPPFARLVDAEGNSVAPFSIDAGSRPDPTVLPGEKKSLQLRYWLDPAHFSGSLDFFVGTARIPVKSGVRIDIQSLANQASLPLTSPDWTSDKSRP